MGRQNVDVQIKKTHEDAVVPEYQYELDAGFDLVSVETKLVRPRCTELFDTGWKVALPPGTGMFILPRSGISKNTFARIPNSPGTVDAGYRGKVKVLIFNESHEKIHRFKKGDRIAQAVILDTLKANFEIVDELPESERSAGGFGHTGVSDE